jgi:sodium transport system ATP-binding protein
MLYTLMRPDAGRVLIDGIDVQNEPTAARSILGVLPDARGIYKRLSARENIAYFGRLHGLDERVIAERSARLAAALDMQDFLDRRAEGYSQGQRTKTAIARALVHEPRNVVLESRRTARRHDDASPRRFLLALRDEGRCILPRATCRRSPRSATASSSLRRVACSRSVRRRSSAHVRRRPRSRTHLSR